MSDYGWVQTGPQKIAPRSAEVQLFLISVMQELAKGPWSNDSALSNSNIGPRFKSQPLRRLDFEKMQDATCFGHKSAGMPETASSSADDPFSSPT